MEMQIAKASQSFGDVIGLQSFISRNFQDIVTLNDREKVARLQRSFEDERREREPNYLPPIYLVKFEEDRVIQTVGFSPEEIGQVRMDHQEMFTFQGSDGQQRAFQVRFGLAKKEATYFIAVAIQVPATPQGFHQASSSPYRESYSRGGETMYGYQTPQQPYAQSQSGSPFGPSQGFGDPRGGDMTTYRAPGPLGSNIPPPQNMPSFAQAQQRPDYSQAQVQSTYQTPRSELPQTQPQPQAQRQHDLQLPPIRDQRGESSLTDAMRRRDDRTGRVDIGGLLENPDSGRRGM